MPHKTIIRLSGVARNPANGFPARPLVRRYYTCQGHLHGDCFYAGIYDPIEETARRLRQTTVYIVDAERLAPGGTLLLRPTGPTSCRP